MSSELHSQRKLAAILFADIEGYTALMQKDEQKAAQILRHFQKQLREKVKAHGGTIVNFYGDGALCTFPIPLHAVRCAMTLQQSFSDPKTPVRIGLHSGTVTLEEGKIFGDSVNVASRIESLGTSGSILLSKKVRDEVKNNPDLEFTSLGSFGLKNVDDPIEVFALSNNDLVVPDPFNSEPRKGKKPFRYLSSRLLLALVGGALLVIALLFLSRSQLSKKQDHTPIVESSNDGQEIFDKSIAVLPFADLSAAGDQQYFSIGMMDEILNHLAKIKGLQVTSRTSVMQFAGSTKTIGEIADELNVANILEGSVRKAKNQVRITVQLIDAKTDKHLWSDSYDKQMVDIFDVQSDVAQNIAHALQTEILPEVKERIENAPTINIEAYELWLRGVNYDYSDDYARAEALYLRAIEIDPEFAPAYASLGYYWMSQGGFAGHFEREEIVVKAKFYLDKAIELDADHAPTHQMLGSFYLWYHWDFAAAEREYQIYARLSPSFINANLISFYTALGRFEEAKELSDRMFAAEPTNLNTWAPRGLAYCLSGDFERGNAYYHQALDLFPDYWYVKSEAARAFAFSGEYDKTIELVNFIHKVSDHRIPRNLGYLAVAYIHTGRRNLVDDLLEELKAQSRMSATGSPSFYVAMIYAQLEDIDLAFEWLEMAYQDREVEMYWLKVEPTFEPLRGDPRWQQMLDKVGFPR